VPPSLAGDGDDVTPEPLAPEAVADEPSEQGLVTAAAATATAAATLDGPGPGATALSPPPQEAPLHELLGNVNDVAARGNTPPRDARPTPATPKTVTLAANSERVQDAQKEAVGKTAARVALDEKVETEAPVRAESTELDDLPEVVKKLTREIMSETRKRAAEAEDHRAKIEAILDQQQKALAKVQAEAADRLARAEELAAERVARAEARVAKAEADIREVEKNTRHWTMTAESDYKAMEERFIARVEAMEKQLQGRGAGGAVPLGDSNLNKLHSSA